MQGWGNACAAYLARTETVRGLPPVLDCLTISEKGIQSANIDVRIRVSGIHIKAEFSGIETAPLWEAHLLVGCSGAKAARRCPLAGTPGPGQHVVNGPEQTRWRGTLRYSPGARAIGATLYGLASSVERMPSR